MKRESQLNRWNGFSMALPAAGLLLGLSLALVGASPNITLQFIGGGGRFISHQSVELQPVHGADRRTIQLQTDESGRIKLPASMAADAWPEWLCVVDGFEPVRMSAAPTLAGSTQVVQTISPRRATTAGGRILDAQGRPVAAARIVIETAAAATREFFIPEGAHFEVSDADGRWTCSHFPTGSEPARLRVLHPDFAARTVQCEVAGGLHSISWQDVRGGRSLVFLKPAARLAGRVVDPAGRPVEGTRIFSAHDPVWTPADGGFSVPAEPEATVRLRLVAAGFAPTTAIIGAAQLAESTTLRLEPGVELQLNLVDDLEQPVAGAWMAIALEGGEPFPPWHGRTDAAGAVRWTGPPEGRVRVSALQPGFVYLDQHPLAVTAEPQSVPLRRLVEVRGRVVDAASGEPVPDFTVLPGVVRAGVFYSETAVRVTARDGGFALRLQPPVEGLRLGVEAPGYYRFTRDLQTTNELAEMATLRLTPGRTFTGRVLRSGGAPVSGAQIALVPAGQRVPLGRGIIEAAAEWLARSDTDGRFEIAPPAPPAHLIAVHPEWGFGHQPVAGSADESTLTLAAWGRLTGRAQAAGEASPGELVALASHPRDPFAFHLNAFVVRADERGNFTLPPVPPGEFLLGRWRDSRLSHAEAVTVPAGGEVAVAFPRPGWRLTGRAVLPAEPLDWSAGPHLAILRARNEAKPVAERTVYQLQLDATGQFSITDVPPGTHDLVIHYHEAFADGSGRVHCRYRTQREIILDPLPAAGGLTRLDLGTLPLAPSPEASEPAP